MNICSMPIEIFKVQKDTADNSGLNLDFFVFFTSCLLLGHPRFPKGLTIGFYYNVCTDTKWYDTELRGPKNVCCKPRTKKFAACPDSEK